MICLRKGLLRFHSVGKLQLRYFQQRFNFTEDF